MRPLDFYAARLILEIVGVTTSFVALLIVLIITGLAPMPKNIPLMVGAWLLFVWFAVGFGMTMGPLLAHIEILSILWRPISMGLMMASGVFFFLAWLPINVREILLWLPMIHGSEMMKNGYFGNLITTYYDPYYFALCNLVLTFTGLMLAKGFGKHVPDRL